ncbi:hypothetical protein LEP1GSC188_2815 [Leptospira weilii serovar Topaz str. LT2116]|uniref:Transcriptional regulator LmrA/YxaF-like C-terminal domain-containing protein n=1 Tax=Leptospira weilii serovar Topaz str. LT2116 TaxID=1088540 RepID=M3H2L8_9LEPT|nr:hypothetical protein LEP1GSC188_2815 [Leptospira weilii serovar Topaz str. LT2116]
MKIIPIFIELCKNLRIIFLRNKSSDFQKGCLIATVILEIATENDRIQKVCSSIYLKRQNLLSSFLQRSEIKEDQVKSISILLLAVVEGITLPTN